MPVRGLGVGTRRQKRSEDGRWRTARPVAARAQRKAGFRLLGEAHDVGLAGARQDRAIPLDGHNPHIAQFVADE